MTPEEVVICHWGDEVRILGAQGAVAGRALAPGENPVPAILQLVGAACPGATRARILHQPDSLEIHDIAGPPPHRARARRNLAAEFPALAASDCRWSAESVPGGGRTLLHIDAGSQLPLLVAGLNRIGCAIDGAWPLSALAFQDAAPKGALCAAAIGQRALIACASPSGSRSVRIFGGDEPIDGIGAAFHAARARFDDGVRPPGWLALEEGPCADALRQAASESGLPEIPLAEALARARLLDPGGLSDFLPPVPLFARPRVRNRTALVLALLFAAGAAAGGRHLCLVRQRREQDEAAENARRFHAEADAAARRAMQGRLDDLSRKLDRAGCAPQEHFLLLQALSKLTPEALSLASVAIQGDEFVVTGAVCEQGPAGTDALQDFHRSLGGPGNPWLIRNAEHDAKEEGAFSIRGSFQAPAAAAARDPAVLESRLKEVLARLPSAQAFEADLKSWSADWNIVAGGSDDADGLDVRRYVLSRDHPGLAAWPAILDSVGRLCREPGLSIDELRLAAAPGGADSFTEAEVRLTIRLRR